MAQAVRGSKRRGTSAKPKPKARARRAAVAKAKSLPRAKAAARAVASPATPSRSPRKPKAAATTTGRARAATSTPADAPAAAVLTDEERIESAKYTPRAARPRVFEEERFLFPQTYGVNRLRLLVKDPEWLFAYWDVDPKSLASLRTELGGRASALSQLTLRVFEDKGGGAGTFLLPQDARTWYVPMRSTGRAYRAEVGVMLPSGEFRPLARSNSVVTPRTGRSAQKAKRRVRYDRGRPLGQAADGGAAGEAADEPWDAPLDAWAAPEEEERPRASSRRGKAGEPGGASDLHRR